MSLILENITTDITNCVLEISEQIVLDNEQLRTIKDIITDNFGERLSEYSLHIDDHSWETDYDEIIV